MKVTHFTIRHYYMIAIIGILTCFIGYAINARPMHMPKQQVSGPTVKSVSTKQPSVKKKNCSCCAERLRALRIRLQKARKTREAQEHQQTVQQTRTGPHDSMPQTPASYEKNAGSRP